jgi:hypothetical protein
VGGALIAAGATVVLRADTPPFYQIQISRQAISASFNTLAGEYAPEYIRAAEDSLRAANREIDRQISRFFAVRNYDLARARAANAQRIARAATTVAAARRDSVRTVAFARMDTARDALRESQAVMGNVQMDRYSRSKLVMLEVLRQEALKAASEGKFKLANDKAQVVIAGAAAIRRTVDDQLENYQLNQGAWMAWARETIEWSRKNQAAAILVRKLDHRCDLYVAGRLKHSYPAELGIRWMGHKVSGGDGTTPEGQYRVVKKKTASRYYKALEINYPNADDQRRFAHAKQAGRIRRTARIGGLIEIHGNGGRGKDWTQGCVALRNDYMDALFSQVDVGTPVTIVGSWNGGDVGQRNTR